MYHEQETTLRKHKRAVMDICWSRVEQNTLVSASNSIFSWDTRVQVRELHCLFSTPGVDISCCTYLEECAFDATALSSKGYGMFHPVTLIP